VIGYVGVLVFSYTVVYCAIAVSQASCLISTMPILIRSFSEELMSQPALRHGEHIGVHTCQHYTFAALCI
jgi:uncharacterized membrane protein YqiK